MPKKLNIILSCLFLVFLSLPYGVFAQQYNTWYFGSGAGLNFNVSPPQPVTDGALYSYEACAVIGDSTGRLLFYTDGISVYNKNHQIMPNGSALSGCQSSTNGVIIIPRPGSRHLYFVFTADCKEYNFAGGYRYSEIDMRLNNGLGDVTTTKNVLLYSPSTERLAAIKASNGIDYWVITKGYGNNRFTNYKVTCEGVLAVPVVSNTGVIHTATPSGLAGIATLKASPDGKKLGVALTNETQNIVQLFDFNNNTGIVSNPISIMGFGPVSAGRLYGLEFSPNSRLLYLSDKTENSIRQYDISSNNAVTINGSAYIIGPLSKTPQGLQLAPNGKIYITTPPDGALNAINNPNTYGLGCDFVLSALSLAGKYSTAGLPVLVSGFTDSIPVDFSTMFINCQAQFTGSSGYSGPVNWYWEFGDGSTDSGMVVNHGFPSPGTYHVTLTVIPFTDCGYPADSIRVEKDIIVNASLFSVNFSYQGNCLNDLYIFNNHSVVSNGNITGYSWDFGDGSPISNLNEPVHNYANPGIYDVKLKITTNGICGNDSIIKKVYVDSKPVAGFLPVSGCMNQPILFNDQSTNVTGGVASWLWTFGDGNSSTLQNPSHTYTNFDNYPITLQSTSLHGCQSATVAGTALIINSPTADFTWQYPCIGQQTLFIPAGTNPPGSVFAWDFGDGSNSSLPSPEHEYAAESIYSVTLTVTTPEGCTASAVNPVNITGGRIFIGSDSFAIYDQPHQLLATGGISYSWNPISFLNNPAIPNPTVRIKNDAVYIVQGTNREGCVGYDTVNLKVVKKPDIYVPGAFTPNADGKNDVLKVLGFGIKQLNYFKIFNRHGQEVFSSTDIQKGWDAKFRGQAQDAGNYVWMAGATTIFGELITKKGSTLLLK